ncbi:DUF4339 domain-containing protein [Ensifer sp. ENS01]|nr:DUF4339 domain-containing protein [Ensifer sp. ENS01]
MSDNILLVMIARDELSPDVLVWRQGHGEWIPACDMPKSKRPSAARRQDLGRPPTRRRHRPNIRLPGHGPVFWRAFSKCCCFTYRLPWWPAAPDADLRQSGDQQADDVRGRLARRGSLAGQHALCDQLGPGKRRRLFRARAGPGNNERTAICGGAISPPKARPKKLGTHPNARLRASPPQLSRSGIPQLGQAVNICKHCLPESA